MKITTRFVLLGTVAAASMALPSLAYAAEVQVAEEEAQAAPPAEETAGYGNEIVVTATKREQTLQDVPVAVSVTTAETIERAQIRDIRDLSSVVPSLRVNQLQSSANTNFYIRGFGNGANNAGIEPSVGLFVDGVYRSRSASMIADLPDIQRVEVLRGPQSTLFGKNASAGVISMTTRKPRFELGGNVEASYGNFNALVVKGVVTGPISETIAASLAGGYNRRDGYVKDGATGADINERNRWFVRGQVLFEPSNDFSVRLIGDYGKIDETCCAVINLRRSAASSVILGLGGKLSDPANPFADVTYNNVDSTNKIENWGLSGQIDYSMGFLKLTSITAYRRTGSLTNQDSDFSSADLIGRNWQDLKLDTFTQELRLNTDWDGPVNLMLGGFYFNEKVDQKNDIFWGAQARPYADQLIRGASSNALNVTLMENTFGGSEAVAFSNPALATKYQNRFFAQGTGLNEAYKMKNESYSIFGQVEFKLADRLTLTGGANYTHDSKTFSTNVVSSDAFSSVNFDSPVYAEFRRQLILGGLVAQGVNPVTAAAQAEALKNNAAFNPLNGLKPLQFLPPFMNVPNAVETGKYSDGDWNWTARLAYELNDNLNAYISYATGYKASSINLSRDSRPSPADLAALKTAGAAVVNLSSGSRFAGPESSTVYEFGLKGNWGVASANVAVFKQSIAGFQSNIFTGTGFFLANAGKQSAFGIEFEGMVKPTPEFTVNLAMTYLDAKYDSFALSAFGDLTGTRPGGVSPLSMTIGAEWNKELGNGDRLILRGDYHYEALFKLVEGLPGFVVKNSAGVITDVSTALQIGRDFKQDVNQVNASITYAMQNGLELSLWGRNLTDNRSILQIFDSPAQSGSISGYPSEPRTWGGSVRFRF
ncbi:TonB-dependent receptor [Novosphingobium sp. TH158]|uniref:TonB-dependent receptor n=1 Tax=Novosphingobium sp. TH158 TaxID=2067455 RepID=UPI000C7CF078|nr:TonB-dependent receptor [Novosphingobium sp. TH158]PLK26358.1 TonB-dependent receptor [Novosphingobium sp. TH158]